MTTGVVRSRALEVRVHGVHGTSPAEMLGLQDGEVRQVAGDHLTGVYRPRDGVLVPGRQTGDGVVVEAYSWGALTSGVAGFFGWLVRALWLLLLPFALTNLAYWARLTLNQGRDNASQETMPQAVERERFTSAMVRLSALLITVFFALTASFIAVDLFAWQCFRAGVLACPRVPEWLMFMTDLRPGRRLALGLVPPVLAVGVLAWLSRSTGRRYESVHITGSKTGSKTGSTSGAVLASPTMWAGEQRLGTDRLAHVGAALGAIAAFTGVHAWRMSVDSGEGPAGVLVLIAITAGLGLLAAAVSVVLAPSYRARPARAALVLSTAALVLLGVTLVLEGPDAYLPYRDFVWHDELFVSVFVVLTMLHLAVFFADRITRPVLWWLVPAVSTVVLGLAAWTVFAHPGADITDPAIVRLALGLTGLFLLVDVWHYRQARVHPTAAWNGSGSSVLLAAALWVSLIFSATAVTAAANYLNGPDSVARLVVSSEPFGKDRPSGLGDEQVSVSGDVVVRPLRNEDGTTRGVSVSADDAWITRATEREQRADPDIDRRVFHLDSRFLPQAEIRIAGGSRVRDLRVGEGVDLSDTGRYLQDRAGSESITPDVVAPVDLVVRDPGRTALVLPPVLVWAPVAILVWLVLSAVILGACVVVFRRYVRHSVEVASADLFRSRRFARRGWDGGPSGPDPFVQVPDRDREAVVAARVSAALGHRAEPLLNWIGIVTAMIGFVMVAFSTTNDWVNLGGKEWFKDSLGVMANVALYLMIAISLALVALGSRMRNDSGWRRHLGILWDLTTFWPRAAHPLAPPCYAERVVPELVTRLRWATEDDASGRPRFPRVVLSAHSQGTCLAVAGVMQLGDPLPAQLRLITYGSQLRGIYGRVFPRVFGPGVLPYAPTIGPIRLTSAFPDVPDKRLVSGDPPGGVEPLRTLRGSLRWVNLFRRADPLGYRVFSDACDDGFDRVVMEVPGEDAGDPGPVVQGHGGYPQSPEYVAVVDAWVSHRGS